MATRTTRTTRVKLMPYRDVASCGMQLVRRADNDHRVCWTVYAPDGREGGTIYDTSLTSLDWAMHAGELGNAD